MINKNEPSVDDFELPLLNEAVEFETSHNQNIIEKLIHLARFGNLLTLVIGNNGCGKTYLLDQLLVSIDDTTQVCHIHAQPLLSIDQLFQQVTESFAGETTFSGIPLTAKQYEEWAGQLSATPGNRLLIIDDAEVLSTSVLHELCQLSAMQQEKDTPHLHIILFGNYDLNHILEQASQGLLGEEGIYAIDIPALTNEQSKQWLEYLFARDGVVFLPEQAEFDNMLVNGQGNLSQLSVQASEYAAKSHDFEEFEEEIDSWRVSGIGYWFAGLSIFIMLILGGFFFQKEIIELLGSDEKMQPVAQIEETVLDMTVVENLDNKTSDDSNKESNKESNETQHQTVADQAIVDTSNTDASANDMSKIDAVQSDAVQSDASNIESTDTEQHTVDTPADQNSEQNSDASESIRQITAPTTSSETVDSNIESIDEPDSDVEQQVQQPVEQLSLTASEQMILSLSADSYAIQLIGLRQEADVKAFIAQHQIPNMVYFKGSLTNKPWYVVILTGYETKIEASQAQKNLPKALLKNSPWIKSLSKIQSEISRAQ